MDVPLESAKTKKLAPIWTKHGVKDNVQSVEDDPEAKEGALWVERIAGKSRKGGG